METNTLYINGSNLSSLVESFKKEVSYSKLVSCGNVFIFAIEKYYLRISSNLLTVVIFSFAGKDRLDVRIISGGGGEGLLGITWGAEGSSNRSIIDVLEELCESNDWDLNYLEDGEGEGDVDLEKLKQVEKDADEYEEMMIEYNKLTNKGHKDEAEKLYDDWCKRHPDEEK